MRLISSYISVCEFVGKLVMPLHCIVGETCKSLWRPASDSCCEDPALTSVALQQSRCAEPDLALQPGSVTTYARRSSVGCACTLSASLIGASTGCELVQVGILYLVGSAQYHVNCCYVGCYRTLRFYRE